ncbi:MAG TPA: hypothetical protein VGJ39_02095 [Vicinamibacterales bacterium]|jgi:hypothetical protein
MVNRKLVWALCGAAVFALTLVPSAAPVSTAHKTTYLTFSQPVSLPGVALGSGTYTFEIANPDTSADVVRVTSRDGSLVYYMGFTHAIRRPNGMSRNQSVSIGESAAGVAPPITAWWPQNESTGRQFVYPRN